MEIHPIAIDWTDTTETLKTSGGIIFTDGTDEWKISVVAGEFLIQKKVASVWVTEPGLKLKE